MIPHRFLPYARQSIDSLDIQEVSRALTADFITRGPRVEAFEEAIANYCGAKYAVAFNSASTALLASCYAAKMGPGDRLITTPNTFVASVTSAMHHGATPIFVDIDRETGNLDLNQVELNLKDHKSSRGRTVILPVHFAGIPVDMRRLDTMIRSPDTIVIEDAAHALGSHYADGQKVGCCAWSQMTVFSFHPAKTITTGEGGMVLTNDIEFYKLLQLFRNNGIVRDRENLENPDAWYEGFYEAHDISSNYNFTDIQAGLGLSQLRRIDSFIEKRRQLTGIYHRLLKDMPNLRLFTAEHDAAVAFHLFVAQVDFEAYNTTRAYVMTALKNQGVGTQLHYIPVYHHPFFKKKSGDISEYFPQMEAYYKQALSLPLYPDLKGEDVEYVVHTLKEILSQEKQKKPMEKPSHTHRHHHVRFKGHRK